MFMTQQTQINFKQTFSKKPCESVQNIQNRRKIAKSFAFQLNSFS